MAINAQATLQVIQGAIGPAKVQITIFGEGDSNGEPQNTFFKRVANRARAQPNQRSAFWIHDQGPLQTFLGQQWNPGVAGIAVVLKPDGSVLAFADPNGDIEDLFLRASS